MPSESVSSDQPAPASFAGEGQAPGDSTDTAALLGQLRDDRLWLLRQIDTGRWPDWRLDLAALERELGQLLEQAEEQLASRR
ncbi:MAG: hypothetical protein VKN15_01800 [Cyanobacteriota bacterium]|nr:hypothetical protein [Cyanobacteriota bacterium]